MRIYRSFFFGGGGKGVWQFLFKGSFFLLLFPLDIGNAPLVARVQVNATDEPEKETHCDVARAGERERGFCRVIKWPPT